jgi:hypothetical protein
MVVHEAGVGGLDPSTSCDDSLSPSPCRAVVVWMVDDASMADINSSAFNYRVVEGTTGSPIMPSGWAVASTPS